MSTSHAEAEVDMTQPASLILKAGTMKIHEEVEKSKGATHLARGELDREEYIRCLMMFWHIYHSLEEGLAANANDNVLTPTYNPALFARASALSSDISFLLGVSDDDSSWKTHPTHQTLISSPSPAFRAYVSRLTHLVEEEPRRLLAHSYIRYMGDLSGGQVMKRNIRKAYGLVDKQGTAFYDFGVTGSEGQSKPFTANMGEVRRIKEWFRDGIDAGVGNDVGVKEALLDEATRAFVLHKNIFDEIKAPSPKTQKPVAWTPSSMPLGQELESSKAVSVRSVLAFMLVVGLARFIIVVGGLSGSQGYAKLEAVHAWIISTVPST
ncbi:heme oxygenase [Thelephora ganbajun]|uniref:Heme oxygenase n=1 Tax=Thelephora ganbajun TaxID=370292 RepID=A0ACB6Z165_THEGA|nr:heme oxygenase [Thelephora ganbajun]